MCLQKTVLKQYKSIYPNDKLKDISNRTNIQITRVFRLMNGSEMKLCEYEAFEKCLPKNRSVSEFLDVAQKCLDTLSLERQKLLMAQMQQALKINFLQEMLLTADNQTQFA